MCDGDVALAVSLVGMTLLAMSFLAWALCNTGSKITRSGGSDIEVALLEIPAKHRRIKSV